MYKLINEIKEVGSVNVNCKDIYYTKSNGIYNMQNILLKDENIEKTQFWIIKNRPLSLFYYTVNGTAKKYRDGSTFIIKESVFPNSFNAKQVIVQEDMRFLNQQFQWKLGLYDHIQQECIFQTNFENYISLGLVENNYLFQKEQLQLLFLKSNTLEKLWEIDLEVILGGGTKFTKYFGSIDNKLIFSAEDHIIFILEKSSGALLKKYKDLPGINKGSFIENVIPDSKSFVLDQEKKLLFGVFGKNYVEINIENESIFFENLSQELQLHDITFLQLLNNNPFTDDHLFITTLKDTIINGVRGHYNSLIALNRRTHKIDWEYTFTGDGIGTNIPLLKDDLLVQKSLEDTLYVFQKE